MKIVTRIILATLLFVFSSAMVVQGVYGQEALQVNIEEAIELALRTSEDVQITENEIDKMQYRYNQAKSAIYPHITGEVTWSRNAVYSPTEPLLHKNYGLDTGVTVTQVLWAFGRISSALRLADKYLTISHLNKDIAQQEIIYHTKLSYYNALLADRTLSIVKESYENARKNKMLLEKRNSSGRSSKRDNIKMTADIASRLPQLNDAQTAFSSAMRTFKVIIGVDTEVPVALREDFAVQYSTLNQTEIKGRLQENEPTLKALHKQIDADEEMVKIRKANFLPTLSAFATWNYQGIGNAFYVRGNNLDHYYIAGVKVSIPIWAGGENVSLLKQAKVDKENSILRLQKTTKEFALELDNAIFEYHEYMNTLKANHEAVELARESFNMTRDLFETGQVSLADLNDAELLLTSQKLALVLTLYNLNTTLAKIEKLAATEL